MIKRPKSAPPSTSTASFPQLKKTSSINTTNIDENNIIATIPTFLQPIVDNLQISDMVVMIEHCCNCSQHSGMSLRHDPKKYEQWATFFLRNLSMLLHSFRLNVRLGVLRVPFTSVSRVGAFEIFLLYRNHEGEILHSILHSKLVTTRWPSILVLEKKLKDFLVQSAVPLYSDESGEYMSFGQDGLKSYPIGFGPWSETPLADESWNYNDSIENTLVSPSKQKLKSKSVLPLNPSAIKGRRVQWVYDSREHSMSKKVFSLSKLVALPENNPSLELIRAHVKDTQERAPPECLAVDEFTAFHISNDELIKAGGGLIAFIKNKQPSQLSYSISNAHSLGYLFYLEAVLVPGKSRNCVVKLVFRLKATKEEILYSSSIYGLREVRLGGPDGVQFATFSVNVGPAFKLRAPYCFKLFDKQYNRPITNEDIEVEIKYLNNENCIEEVVEASNNEHVYTFSTDDSIVKIPDLFEGTWKIVFTSNAYISFEQTFIKYQDSISTASLSHKIFLQHRVLLPYMMKPKPMPISVTKGTVRVCPQSDDVYLDIVMITEADEDLPDDSTDHEHIDGTPPESPGSQISCKAESSPKGPTATHSYCGSFRCNKAISFVPFITAYLQKRPHLLKRSHEKLAVFQCSAFILPGMNPRGVDDSDLKNGFYSSFEGNPTFGTTGSLFSPDTVLRLKSFSVSVSLSDAPNSLSFDSVLQMSQPILDSNALKVIIRFTHKDLPVNRRDVTASFTVDSKTNSNESSFLGPKSFDYSHVSTDDYGCCSFIVPGIAGTLFVKLQSESGMILTYERYFCKRKKLNVVLATEKSSPVRALKSLTYNVLVEDETIEWNVNIASDCEVLSRIPDDASPSRPLIVLADISGSMVVSEFRMSAMKKTLLSLYSSAIEADTPIALVAWCSWNFYCAPEAPLLQTDGGTSTSRQLLRYLTANDSDAVNTWVEKLRANGGNNMRFAIEDAMNAFADAKDVIVFCDGDVRPFTTKGGNAVPLDQFIARPDDRSKEAVPLSASWASFCRRYPAVRFHFVAIDKDSQHDEMSEMSLIGKGTFTFATK